MKNEYDFETRARAKIAEAFIKQSKFPLTVEEGRVLYSGDLDLKIYRGYIRKDDAISVYVTVKDITGNSQLAEIAALTCLAKEEQTEIFCLKLEKQLAISRVDYSRAAELRDRIVNLSEK